MRLGKKLFQRFIRRRSAIAELVVQADPHHDHVVVVVEALSFFPSDFFLFVIVPAMKTKEAIVIATFEVDL